MTNNQESTDVEVINPNAVTVTDDGKKFELVTKCENPEELFLDRENFAPMLEQVKKIARGLVADATTKEGAATRKALSRKIAGLKNAIEDEGKKVAAALKSKPKIVDATRKAVKDTLEMLQDEVMKPLKDIEARQNEIVEISNIPASAIGCDSFGIQDIINVLESHVHDQEYWAESFSDAMQALTEARRQLNAMLDSALKQEEQQREYERLKAEEAERNRRAAEEAAKAKAEAEKAKAEAEEAKRRIAEAEAAKAKAEEIAERNRRAAEEAKATAQFVQSGNAAHAIKDAEKTKSEMLFPDDRKYYERTCKTETKEDLMKHGLTEEQARDIVIAVLSGKVRHLAMMF